MKCPCCDQKITSFKDYCLAVEKQLGGSNRVIFKTIIELDNKAHERALRDKTCLERHMSSFIRNKPWGLIASLERYGLTVINTSGYSSYHGGVYSIVPLEGV